VRLFAIGAVAVLLASGAVLALTWPSSAPQPEAAARSGPGTSSVGLPAKASPVEQLNALASMGADPATAIRQATADSSAAMGAASASLAAALEAVRAESLAKLPPLPALPSDYLPGMDLAGSVKLPKPAAFPVPVYGGGLTLPGFETKDILDSVSPAVAPSGPHAPPTGSAAADAALAQLLQAYGALAKTLETANLSNLPAPPVGVVPEGLLPPLPVPGLGGGYPAQARDANDAADPDEQGAKLARVHAGELLASVEAAYAVSHPSLGKVLTAYQGLADRVEAMLEETHNATTQAETAIQAQLEERLAAIEASAEQARQQAVKLTSAHRAAVQSTAQKAQALLTQAANAQAAAIQDAVAGDLAQLQELSAQAQATALARRADIQKLAGDALAQVEAGSAAEAAIQAAGEGALKKVGTETQARVQAFQAAATDLQARAQAAMRQLTRAAGAASQRINDTVEQALQQADDTQAYLTDLARAQADVATAAQQAAADAVLAKLPGLEKARADKLVQTALKATENAKALAKSVGDLTDRVAGLTGEQVGKDIGYIAKVSADYGRVPTSQRLERSGFWSGVAHTADSRLGTVLSTTGTLEQMSGKLLLAAQQAEAQIESLG
jgi:hypothetical protein